MPYIIEYLTEQSHGFHWECSDKKTVEKKLKNPTKIYQTSTNQHHTC